MTSDLSAVLRSRAEELIDGATARLLGRPEFLRDRGVVSAEVRRCVDALRAADAGSAPDLLAQAALAVGRADSKQDRGYRRAQLVLEAICAEAVEQVRDGLPRTSWRGALDRLRALLGPAQVGLAAIFRTEPTRPALPRA